MMLMAVDHASALIARQHASEFWAGAMSAYTAAFPFLTRLVTHLCAPGFFFLMGAGIYWFAAKNPTGAGRRTFLRGLTIFGIGQLVETPLMFAQTFLAPAKVSLNQISAPPPSDGSAVYWGFITLSGLGLVMMACSALVRLRPWTWLLVPAVCVFATNSFLPPSGQPGPWWMAILLRPGIAQHIVVVYPVLPWLAGAASGMYFAWWWRRNPERASQRVWVIGVALLASGVAIRAAGAWGNIRLPRDAGWIEFLNNVKYPPSLVFWTMSLGADLLLLAGLARLRGALLSDRSPLIVFGQTPLFFYVAHFYLLALCAFVFFREAAPLEGAYGMWLVVLALLYPLCLRYRNFKMARPKESVWRLL